MSVQLTDSFAFTCFESQVSQILHDDCFVSEPFSDAFSNIHSIEA